MLAHAQIDWGNVPAWLTLLGILGGAWAYTSGRRDAKRRSAAAVFPVVLEYSIGGGPTDPRTALVAVANEGDRPAFAVGVALYGWGRRRLLWRFRHHTEWMVGGRITGCVYPTVMPGTQSTPVTWNHGLDHPTKKQGGLDYRFKPLNVVLVFGDSSGRQWVRWPMGQLSRLRPSRSLAKLPKDRNR